MSISAFSIAGQIVAGLAVGYVAASFVESVAHQHVSDAPNRYSLFWKHHPRLFGHFLKTYFSHHIIHHVRTFRTDHVTQFSSPEEKVRLDEVLARHGRHGALIKKASYAVKLQGGGALTFVAPLVATWPLLYLAFGPWVAVGALVTMSGPPILSNWAHPHLHKPHDRARAEAPAWVSWLLGTRYGRAMMRNHFLHHRYEDCCYNLLLGADYMRGAYRSPSPEDIAEMERIGIPVR